MQIVRKFSFSSANLCQADFAIMSYNWISEQKLSLHRHSIHVIGKMGGKGNMYVVFGLFIVMNGDGTS